MVSKETFSVSFETEAKQFVSQLIFSNNKQVCTCSDIGIEQAKFVGLGQSQVTHKSHRMAS